MFHQVVVFQEQILGNIAIEKGLLSKAELDLSVNQLSEEIQELMMAHDDIDYIGAVDAAVDLLYFGVGVLHKLGLTPEQMGACFTAVHEANMEKKKGIVARRGDGTAPDAIKPEGWTAPEERIAAILGGA